MSDDNEVTAADIARLAGVGRAAVSNWRRRYPDFPDPVGGPTNSPTFSRSAVEAWLNAHGREASGGASLSARPRPIGPTSERVAAPMAALLPSLSRGTVLDPACGDGTLLAASAERLGSGPRYCGQDVDPALVVLAREALADAGATDVVIAAADDQGARLRADAVISAVPPGDRLAEGFTFEYGQPARADQALGWVQICQAALRPGGVAVVAVPFSAAVRASGRRIRAELLRAGVLTHVIALPDGAVGNTTVPWQVWVLTKPAGRPTYVLRMVDLLDRSPDELPQDDAAWATVFADPTRTRDVPSIELLDEDVLLVPSAHVALVVRDVTPEYTAQRDRYAAAVRALRQEAPTLTAGAGPPTGSLVTLGDLSRAGALTFVDREAAQAGDVAAPWGSGGFETVVLDDASARRIESGPVIRCIPDALDAHFLACFLRSETNRRQAAGTSGGTFRLDVRRAHVPRMPLSEQRRFGDAFRQLMAFTANAEDVMNGARAVTNTAIYGLTSGIFAPPAMESELST